MIDARSPIRRRELMPRHEGSGSSHGILGPSGPAYRLMPTCAGLPGAPDAGVQKAKCPLKRMVCHRRETHDWPLPAIYWCRRRCPRHNPYGEHFSAGSMQ
jgi:hypothetical protein